LFVIAKMLIKKPPTGIKFYPIVSISDNSTRARIYVIEAL